MLTCNYSKDVKRADSNINALREYKIPQRIRDISRVDVIGAVQLSGFAIA